MKVKLYDCFKHWMQYDSIWLYSDPHFGDEQSQGFRKRRFNYEVTDDEQVARINAKVGKKDLLIILGDVGDVSYISKLKAGYKVLIQGNHDKGKTIYQRTIVDGKDNRLFDEVYDGKLQIRKDIILSHEPVNDEFCFNFHGHKHPSIDETKKTNFQKWYEKMTTDPFIFKCGDLDSQAMALILSQSLYLGYTKDNHFNCCAEMIGFTPINMKEIAMSGVLNDVVDMHRKVIDRREDCSTTENTVKCSICGQVFHPSSLLQDVCDKCAIEIGESYIKNEG